MRDFKYVYLYRSRLKWHTLSIRKDEILLKAIMTEKRIPRADIANINATCDWVGNALLKIATRDAAKLESFSFGEGKPIKAALAEYGYEVSDPNHILDMPLLWRIKPFLAIVAFALVIIIAITSTHPK